MSKQLFSEHWWSEGQDFISTEYQRLQYVAKERERTMSIEKLVEAFDKSLRDEFNRISEVPCAPSVKGTSYENILKGFLEGYLGGVFTFNTRVALVDDDHKVFGLFKPGRNEFDVVATYKTSFPNAIFQCDAVKYVSYDSCAFIIEVAQTLIKQQIEDDLDKLSKLSKLGPRGGNAACVASPNNISYVPRLLFYNKPEINSSEMMRLLVENIGSWELVLVYDKDLLFVNHTLPIARARSLPISTTGIPDKPIVVERNSLLWMFHALMELLPYPLIVDAFGPFRKALFASR